MKAEFLLAGVAASKKTAPGACPRRASASCRLFLLPVFRNHALIVQNHPGDDSSRLLILNTLASYYIEHAISLSPNDTFTDCMNIALGVDELLAKAAQLLNKAEAFNRFDPFTLVGKGNTRIVCNQTRQTYYLCVCCFPIFLYFSLCLMVKE